MPGSKKAVSECFAAIVDIIPHALQHMHNDTTEIRRVHFDLQANGKVGCCPEHSNGGTSNSASNGHSANVINNTKEEIVKSTAPARVSHEHVCPHKTGVVGDPTDRNSPYPMMPVKECLKVILSSVLPPKPLPEWTSHLDLPPFRASIKDGYALKSCGGMGKKRVVKYISAGDDVS